MIRINNLRKVFGLTTVLKGIDLELGDRGLVMIVGPSGCGKSTLLHCLSLLLDCEGDIYYERENYNYKTNDEKEDFRLRHIGLIFQDFKLFENETVYQNVLLPRSSIEKKEKERNQQDVLDTLGQCGIRNLSDQVVNTLSGGEKQRVAIARALINHPKYVFADEPTGSLDHESGNKVMSLLRSVSKDTLVVVVTHDVSLVSKYADRVLYLEDGVISQDEEITQEEEVKELNLPKNIVFDETSSLSSSFIFRHIHKINKSKRWRSSISKVVISLGLIGAGLSFILSDALTEIVMGNYSQLISDDQVIIDTGQYYTDVKRKDALPYEEVERIALDYDDYIYDVGVTYLNDLTEFFFDENRFAIGTGGGQYTISGLDASDINDFIWLDLYPPDVVYPQLPVGLDDDEVVLGLTKYNIDNICTTLNIEQDVGALSNYVESHNLKLYFYAATEDWTYSDEQVFTIRGFALTKDKKNCIYHYNHRWNEKILEEDMFMPNSDELYEDHDFPWVLDKLYYLECGDYLDEFLEASYRDKSLQNAVFDCANEEYFSHYNEKPEAYHTRLMVYNNLYDSYISPYKVSLLKERDSNIKSFIYGSNLGYAIYGGSYMSGFATETYISFSTKKLDEVIDIFSYYKYEGDIDYELDEVLKGHYTVSSTKGVVFYPLDGEDLLLGEYPISNDEVVVSTGLLSALGYSREKIPTDKLYIANAKKAQYLSNNYVLQDFSQGELTICGIIDCDEIIIYQEDTWIPIYFMTRFGTSAFDLLSYGVAVNTYDSDKLDDTLSTLKAYMPNYNVYSPLKEVNDSVKDIVNYIQIGIIVFSIVAIVASLLLIFSMVNLLVVENKKEFGLLTCLGIRKKQAFKMILGYGVYLCFISFLISVLELFFVFLILSLAYSTVTITSSFITAIVVMLALALFLGVFSCLLKYRSITKLEPLEAIKK
ncbi:MAG: ATP-binding cassette domain-containing protein [Coprobacillus sp.]|nr:ATP-binding cassette domain-containing protein [Coprobacillus sp.]